MNTKNLIKYITFAVVTFIILRYIPKYKLETNETISLTCLICSLMVIIDTVSPCIMVDKSKCIKPPTLLNKSKSNTKTKSKK
jgi:hypothetical protein